MSEPAVAPRHVTASTQVAAVIGTPIRHSLSPVIHNAAFEACGLDWAYLAFEVADGHGAAAVGAVRILGLRGLSVTMPHKAAAAAAVDRLSPAAAALGVVNCVVVDGDELVGHNTDGAGFLGSLAAEARWQPSGRRCVVVGAGGAARAVIAALADAGADEVGVVNRTRERAESAAALAGAAGRVVESAAISEAELVVNATSVGMGDRAVPFAPELLAQGQVVVDLVYEPVRTALLEAAEQRGAVAVDGVGMLVHQAAAAFELWTGLRAPIEVMSTAARRVLEVPSTRPAAAG